MHNKRVSLNLDLDMDSKDILKLIHQKQRKNKLEKLQNNETSVKTPTLDFKENQEAKITDFESNSNSSLTPEKKTDEKKAEVDEDILSFKENKNAVFWERFNKESYLDYHLKKNPDYLKEGKSSRVFHPFLPKEYKNDENYKVNLFNYIRDVRIPPAKTQSCKQATYLSSCLSFDSNLCKYEKLYENFPKKKRVPKSTRKFYQGEVPLYDENGNKYYFKIFRDEDIGFTNRWQKKIIIADHDDDVNSDSDQITYAKSVCLKDLCEGIKYFNRNHNYCFNYRVHQKENDYLGYYSQDSY